MSPMVLSPYQPFSVKINVHGLDKAVRMAGYMGMHPVAPIAVQEAADWLQMNLQEYPPLPHPKYKLRFYSAKQRRFVMWAIRTGVIQIPYKRTRRLAEGWKVRVDWHFRSSQIKAVVYNTVPYVRWVMGDRMQAYMHRGYWPRMTEVYKREKEEINRIIRDTVNAYLKKAKR